MIERVGSAEPGDPITLKRYLPAGFARRSAVPSVRSAKRQRASDDKLVAHIGIMAPSEASGR